MRRRGLEQLLYISKISRLAVSGGFCGTSRWALRPSRWGVAAAPGRVPAEAAPPVELRPGQDTDRPVSEYRFALSQAFIALSQARDRDFAYDGGWD